MSSATATQSAASTRWANRSVTRGLTRARSTELQGHGHGTLGAASHERLRHHRRCFVCGDSGGVHFGARSAIKAARAEKNAELARELGKLRKPTQTAWLINVLWRDQREVMEQMLQLGEELSHAQASASGPALQRLTSQRRELEAALLRRARELAQKAGVTVTPQMEREAQETLAAALARPTVADEVRSGRLVKPASLRRVWRFPATLPTQPTGQRAAEPEKEGRKRSMSTRLARRRKRERLEAGRTARWRSAHGLARGGASAGGRGADGAGSARAAPGFIGAHRAGARTTRRSSKRRPPRSNARRSTQRAVASTPNARTPLPSVHSSAPNRS